MSANDFDSLSIADQIEHVQDLWDRIAAKLESTPISEDQLRELDRRIALYEKDPTRVISWQQAVSQLPK